MINIGERVKLLRKEKGLTQKQLADAIHKSEITVRKYEANDIAITVDVLEDILNILDSKLTIESKKDSNSLLRQYIDSLDVSIDEDTYKEIELFIHHYILVRCSPEYRHNIKNITLRK